jgi:putative polyketide hydroxylase
MSAMAHDGDSEVPVLIVGAGPAGLAAAVTLARYGVACTLVERRCGVSALPRATAISTRSMELLRSWGLEREIRAGGVDVEWQQWFCETLAAAARGKGSPVGMPTREQSAISPTGAACVPQDHLEPVLLRHLRALATSRVELGTELVGIDSGPGGVRAVLRDVAGASGGSCTPATSSQATVRTAPCGHGSAFACAAPTTSSTA